MRLIRDPVSLAKKLVSIPSESESEDELANFIAEYLTRLGYKVIRKKGYLLIVGTGDLLINGHLDTVPVGDRKKWHYEPLGQIVGRRLYGRGSCDTKGNVACVLAALTQNPTNMVSLSFTFHEEDTYAGVQALIQLRHTRLKHIHSCINLEPTNLRLVTAHKGQITFRVEASGVPAHASTPELGTNAIYKLVPIIQALHTDTVTAGSQKWRSLLLGPPTLNVGIINGGAASNVVPAVAHFVADRRVVPGERNRQIIARLRKIAKDGEVTILRSLPPFESSTDNELVRALQHLLREHRLNPKQIGVNFTTEFSVLAQHGITGCVFGAGNISQAHTYNEWVSLAQLNDCFEVFSELFKTL